MFRTIRNALLPFTTRSTSEDRSPEEAETVPSGCWRGARTLRHKEESYTRVRTYGAMDSYDDRSLTLRAVRAPSETAQPAPADENLCDVILSKKMPLKLSLPERPCAGENGIINFDCAERGYFYCLELGLKHEAFYLGECESGRSFIDLPLKPGVDQPRYLLTPNLRDDFVGIKYYDECIRVSRAKNYSPNSDLDCLFMPEGRLVIKSTDRYLEYKGFSGAIHEGGEALEKPKGYESVFWGQFSPALVEGEGPNFPVYPKWIFYCQDAKELHDRITIWKAESSLTKQSNR